jgi:hypothetical protein
MRVKTKSGKFAKRESALWRFVNRTGLDAAAYEEWARGCGERASFSYKDRMICERFGLGGMEELRDYKKMELKDGVYEFGELSDLILDVCENVAELAASYLVVLENWRNYEDKHDFIEANLSGFSKESFRRWSDVNLMGQVSGSWFNSKGLGIDVQAEALSGCYFSEITIEDIVEHVTTYKKGKYMNERRRLIKDYENRLNELCGFNVSEKYAMRLANVINGQGDVAECVGVVEGEQVPF